MVHPVMQVTIRGEAMMTGPDADAYQAAAGWGVPTSLPEGSTVAKMAALSMLWSRKK
jgi:hypothetical protein